MDPSGASVAVVDVPSLELATHVDYLEILDDLPDFWATSGPPERTRPYHSPLLVHQFGDTAIVIRREGRVIAYLFGFIATSEPIGYVHLVGVRTEDQRRGLGRALYDHFGRTAAYGVTAAIMLSLVAVGATLARHEFGIRGAATEESVSTVPAPD